MYRTMAFVVMLGYLLMWIMIPTNKFNTTWLPALQSWLNSSNYFGTQGATLVIYPLPMLLIAVLGCLYLHSLTTSTAQITSSLERSKTKRRREWKRPTWLRGPLGIVSGTELVFLTVFLALLVWSFVVYLRHGHAAFTSPAAAIPGETLWQARFRTWGLVFGFVGNICLAALFIPVARGSPVLPLFGLTSEGSIKYHIWLGHVTLFLFTLHALSYVILWTIQKRVFKMFMWRKADESAIAAEISLVAGLIMWGTSVPQIRRKSFELFFYTHYLYIVFVVFFIFHVGISYAYTMLPGFYIFLVDRYLRLLQSRRRVHLVSVRILPCQALELNFSKSPGLRYNTMSIIFLNVRFISKLQWHPFTVISNSNLEPTTLSVLIKSSGSWTTILYMIVSSPYFQHHLLDVSVEGPYGPVSTDFQRHDTIVLISGGSGITPFISIIRELIHRALTQKWRSTTQPKVILVCTFKTASDLTMLDLILPISESPSLLSHLDITIEAYVTQDTEPPTSNDKLSKLHARWFKPHETDVPISPTLGTNSWLWLASIISSSFTAFVIIVGVVGRYYIFPIDHNTDMVFSWSGRSVVTMLILCTCISVTASAAVVWNKRWSAKEAEKDHSDQKDGTGGSSSEYVKETTTNVHYGKRPDLKRILFDCKGESIGVLASGPKKMRQDVAKICSCGLVKNLHFESISFSW
ncbi:Ferric reduction oxidase 2 [Linum perenne]